MLPWLLNAVYAGLLLAAMPVVWWRRWTQGKYRDGWRQKLLGGDSRRFPDRPCLWLHAVSVGEVLQLPPLVARLRQAGYRDYEIVVSVTTGTGHAVAREKLPDCTVRYGPLDFSWAVARTLRAWRPELLVLVELELWPNLIRQASQSGARVVVANGRLGAKSFRGYWRLRGLWRPILGEVDAVLAQTTEYAERFRALGARNITVTGNIKFDNLQGDRNSPRCHELRRHFSLPVNSPVFVAGSTQPGEEAAAVLAWRAARQVQPGLQLVLVPRHQERFREVAAELRQQGLDVVCRSEPARPMVPGRQDPNALPRVYLLDTLGELGACWGLADVAFVGGSLTNRGGQNMLEPAAYGAAVMFGPNTWNFKDVVESLLARDAARVVLEAEAMSQQLQQWLSDAESRRAIGERARQFVMSQHGALERTVELLSPARRTSVRAA